MDHHFAKWRSFLLSKGGRCSVLLVSNQVTTQFVRTDAVGANWDFEKHPVLIRRWNTDRTLKKHGCHLEERVTMLRIPCCGCYYHDRMRVPRHVLRIPGSMLDDSRIGTTLETFPVLDPSFHCPFGGISNSLRVVMMVQRYCH